MLSPSSSTYLDKVTEWLKPRATDRDLFDVLQEQIDSGLCLSLEALRDEELSEIEEQGEDWD